LYPPPYLETVAKSQKYVGAQKQKLAQMDKSYVAVLPTLQALDANRKGLESESAFLSIETEKMNNFMNNSQNIEIGNFANLVTPADEFSEQILEYHSSIKAREETLHLLEHKFNEEQITFEEFMKHARKLEEGKFVDRFMLTETLQNYSNLSRLR
jgi:predicted  nucleic acid-binding Zn-ribbon protein